MRLEHSPPVVKCGARTLVHHAPGSTLPPLDDHCIDPVGRQKLAGRQLAQVDGRNPELTAPPISLPDPPHHPIGASQHGPGVMKIPTCYRAPDSATRNQLTTQVYRLDHIDCE